MDQESIMIQRVINNGWRHKIQWMCFLCLFPVLLFAQTSTQGRKNPFDVTTKPRETVHKQQPKSEPSSSKQAAKPINAAIKGTASSTKGKTSAAGKGTIPVADVSKMRQSNNRKDRDPVYLERALTLSFDKDMGPDYQLVTGDVVFRHDSARLYCDSAFFYRSTNSLLALGNVHMEQGDTLFLYAAWMYYDGNTKLAKAREMVRLENRDVTLFTDSLNFDRLANIGYFFDGGLLVDESKEGTNELSSEYGQYSTESKEAWFKNDVKLVNPDFVMTTQQLFYNTNTEVASIVSPTEIVSDSGYIYSTRGWYNTKTEQSHLLDRSYANTTNRHLVADTLDYNSLTGVGIGFGNVVMVDTLHQITLKGAYGYSDEKQDYALLTKNALMIEHSSNDTLYLHADTLLTVKDSIYQTVKAFHGVRFYRSDLQGLCDSMFYSTKDSILYLTGTPVIWSEEQQLTGEEMFLHTKSNKPERLRVEKSALVIAWERDSLYNQSSGKNLVAFFDSLSNEVTRVEISGNAETIYLPIDEDNLVMGLNRLEGSYLTLYRKEGKLEKLLVWPQPKGTFYPLDKLPAEKTYLERFKWHGDARPKDPEDVFRSVSITSSIEKE